MDDYDFDNDYDDDPETDTVTCQECGRDVYEDAPSCPYCGAYIVEDKRVWANSRLANLNRIVALLLIICFAGSIIAAVFATFFWPVRN